MPLNRLILAPALLAALLGLPAYSLTPVAGRNGMVASSEPLASQAGVEILQAGAAAGGAVGLAVFKFGAEIVQEERADDFEDVAFAGVMCADLPPRFPLQKRGSRV